MKNLKITPELILKLTSSSYLITKFISFNLWFSFFRTVPEIRDFNFFNPEISTIFTNILSALSICILFFLVFKSNKFVIILLLIIEFTLSCFDQFRWQAYVFQFFLTYFFYIFYPKRFFTLLLILLSATYIYSGINKINAGFINEIWRGYVLNDFLKLPNSISSNTIILRLGYLVGLTEFGLGILILFNRKVFFGIALLHLFVLLLIGPFGIKINEVVWPWNLLMLAIALIYCFLINYKITINFKLDFKILFVVLIAFVLPALNFYKLYNPYFSFELYSGKTKLVFLVTRDKYFEKYKIKNLNKHTIPCKKDDIVFNINELSYSNLKVPIPPYLPSIKLYVKNFKKRYKSKTTRFLITDYPYKKFKNI